jgi:hypothetical protein
MQTCGGFYEARSKHNQGPASIRGDHLNNQKEKPRGFLITNGHICHLVYVDVCIRR